MLSRYERCHFQGQHPGEEVQEIIHRHWFNIFLHLFVVIALGVLLVGSFLILPLVFPDLKDEIALRFSYFLQNTLFIFLWIYGFLIWIDYYFDVWVITNERIVNIEQKGLFAREVSELKFSNVQDVTSTVEGLLPTVLNYGDVYVQTAGEKERFVFRMVPDPYAVKDKIMRLSQKATDDNLHRMAGAIRQATSA